MENNGQVDISRLREAIERVLGFVENELNINQLVLEQGFYWEVDRSDVYSMGTSSPRVTCGNLADDWDFVLAAHKNPEQAMPSLFMHIAPLLQYLAVTLPNFSQTRKADK